MADAPPEQRKPNVLFICADPVDEQMAGLGIRCWELARTLRESASVTIAHGGSSEGTRGGVRLLPYRPHAPSALRGPIARADTIVTHPQWPLVDRWLRRSAARVVIDLYCPETLETLELTASGPARLRRALTATTLDRLHAALRTGHHFICASEAQRDLWLGAMLALRLIGPDSYDLDPSMRETLDLVPFGVPDEPVRADVSVGPRRRIAGLGEDDEIVLWNGGIWSWLDAPTAIRAVAAIAPRRPRVRLVFMGASDSHPAAASSTAQARELARELGLLGSVVHFADGWVPYAERGAWLQQASCALSAAGEHLETRFAYRTRLLDCFWAGLPIVCTSGDDLAEQVGRERLGAVAPPGDAAALASALEQVLDAGRDAFAQGLAAAAERQRWTLLAAPLRRWLAQPSLPPRLGESREALSRPLGQRARELAYLAGGRLLLARRAARSRT